MAKYFTLKELCESREATRRSIDNFPSFEIAAHLQELTDKILDPLRWAWGGAINVTSGYRCPKLNAAVGGVKGSQHLLGQAADIKAADPSENGQLFNCIASLVRRKKINVGQLIWEYGNKTNPKWVHVSLPRVGKPNNQFLYYYS